MSNHQGRASVAQQLSDNGVREKLERMEADLSLNTPASYHPNLTLYPENQMSFADKHMEYLMNHPKLDSQQYLANLHMKIRAR